MLGTIKAISIGGLISLQIFGNPGVPADTNANQDTQYKVQIQDQLIDEIIDECDIEDADRFLDNMISDFLKNRF